MDEKVLIALTGFGVAFFHAAIPTHWLPFVITSRAQRWTRNKAISVTALAGTGHVLFTAFLGVLIAWFGIALHEKIGWWFPFVAGGALLLFGLFYVYRQVRGTGHGHSHIFGGHSHHGTAPYLHTHTHRHAPLGIGPNGGRLIDTGNGLVEIAICEDGNEGRFRLSSVDPSGNASTYLPVATGTTLETIRPDQTREDFSFQEHDGCLVSNAPITKPYRFIVRLNLVHGDHSHSSETRFLGPDEKDLEAETIDIITPRGLISDRVAITSLLALLTFSPCESFLPVYVSGVQYGWMGFILLTAILSIATVAGMVTFTWLTLSRLEKLNLRFLEKYESGIIGGLLCTLGLLIILIEK